MYWSSFFAVFIIGFKRSPNDKEGFFSVTGVKYIVCISVLIRCHSLLSSCAISSRHTSWTSRWSPSKNWQTGCRTCTAWELLRMAWQSTCLTNTPWAKKAAKSYWQKLSLYMYICILLPNIFKVWSHLHDSIQTFQALLLSMSLRQFPSCLQLPL